MRGRLRGLSDRGIAWLFIAPDHPPLLAINIFPLIWTIYLSFTNFKANRPIAAIDVGRDRATTAAILTDPDVWAAMQVTAHFVFWTILLQVVLGFGLALLINSASAATASGPR